MQLALLLSLCPFPRLSFKANSRIEVGPFHRMHPACQCDARHVATSTNQTQRALVPDNENPLASCLNDFHSVKSSVCSNKTIKCFKCIVVPVGIPRDIPPQLCNAIFPVITYGSDVHTLRVIPHICHEVRSLKGEL